MFSSRLDWGQAANPLAQLLQQRRVAGASILDLTESNPTAAQFEYPAEQILDALADRRSLRYEPEPMGMMAARTAVADYYCGRVDPERILLTASTSEGYSLVFKLLANPGMKCWSPGLLIRCSSSSPRSIP